MYARCIHHPRLPDGEVKPVEGLHAALKARGSVHQMDFVDAWKRRHLNPFDVALDSRVYWIALAGNKKAEVYVVYAAALLRDFEIEGEDAARGADGLAGSIELMSMYYSTPPAFVILVESPVEQFLAEHNNFRQAVCGLPNVHLLEITPDPEKLAEKILATFV